MSVKWLRKLRDHCPVLAERAEELNADDGFEMYQSKNKAADNAACYSGNDVSSNTCDSVATTMESVDSVTSTPMQRICSSSALSDITLADGDGKHMKRKCRSHQDDSSFTNSKKKHRSETELKS
jgi:hypothetical protein